MSETSNWKNIKDEAEKRLIELDNERSEILTLLGREDELPKPTRGPDKAPRKRKGQEAPCQQ